MLRFWLWNNNSLHIYIWSMLHRYSHKLASPFTIMRLGLISGIILVTLLIEIPVEAQGVATPIISSPNPGQALQGQVAITGTTEITNFASAELDFSYISDDTDTRFLIQTMTEPVLNNLMTTWDTTSLSDGEYLLRLRVYLTDGTFQDISIPVQIRNYSILLSPTPPIPTIMPTEPIVQIPSPIIIVPSTTPTQAPLPTATLLPMNPAEKNINDVYIGFWSGGLIILLLFAAFGITIRLRRS